MQDFLEIRYEEVENNIEYEDIVKKIAKECFEEEKLNCRNILLCVTLTSKEIIKRMNKAYRNIDKETDVLSFPMFEKEELDKADITGIPQVLGDIVISIERVKMQAREYNHSFERELSYMVVHGFYHLMGYDHIEENDKKQMREKEENILNKLGMEREIL